MRRRSFAVVVAAIAAVLAPAVPASAAGLGTCSVTVPSKVRLDSPYEVITATLSADCVDSGTSYASWDVRHSYYGPSGIFIMDGVGSDTMGFYDWDHLGTYYVEPSLAYDSEYADVAQNSTKFTVKLGTRVSLTASRSGRTVTLRTKTTSYSPSADAFRAWRKATVSLQYRTCASCAWTHLKTVTTGTYGTATFRTAASKVRYYRAIARETGTRWSRTSVTRKR